MFRNESLNVLDNYWNGIVSVFIAFMIICAMILPNGPFTRPHPILWRIVLGFLYYKVSNCFIGIAIFYLLILVFFLFQSYDTVKEILYFIDPSLKLAQPDTKVILMFHNCLFLFN